MRTDRYVAQLCNG